MKKRIATIILFCLLGSLSLIPGHLTSKEPVKTKLKFYDGHKASNIPIKNDNNLVFIKVRVNQSEPVWFILDTGAPLNGLDLSFAKQLKLDLSKEETLSASKRKYSQVNGLTLSLAGLSMDGQAAAVLDFQALWPMSGIKIEGILGYPFLSRVVTKIDYAAKLLSLYDPDHFKYQGAGEQLPLTLNDKPRWTLISVTLHQENCPPVKGKVVLDTGSTMALVVMNGDLARETIENPMYAGIDGTGKGGCLGRIQSIQIGKYLLRNPVAAFPTLGNSKSSGLGTAVKQSGLGLLGSEILSRFNLIFDYQKNILIAEPNTNFNRPHEWDMSGMFVIATGGSFKTFKVFRVMASSPAALAGIKEGDVILEVDDQPTDRFSLSQLRDLLKKNGRKLILKIKRDKKIVDVSLILKRLI